MGASRGKWQGFRGLGWTRGVSGIDASFPSFQSSPLLKQVVMAGPRRGEGERDGERGGKSHPFCGGLGGTLPKLLGPESLGSNALRTPWTELLPCKWDPKP